MSTNCIDCIKNKRTGSDLLCDECRVKEALKQAKNDGYKLGYKVGYEYGLEDGQQDIRNNS